MTLAVFNLEFRGLPHREATSANPAVAHAVIGIDALLTQASKVLFGRVVEPEIDVRAGEGTGDFEVDLGFRVDAGKARCAALAKVRPSHWRKRPSTARSISRSRNCSRPPARRSPSLISCARSARWATCPKPARSICSACWGRGVLAACGRPCPAPPGLPHTLSLLLLLGRPLVRASCFFKKMESALDIFARCGILKTREWKANFPKSKIDRGRPL